MSDEQNKDQDPAKSTWGPMGGGPPKHPQFVLKQVANLKHIQAMLEGVVGKKQAERGQLQEQLLRLKHGGGS